MRDEKKQLQDEKILWLQLLLQKEQQLSTRLQLLDTKEWQLTDDRKLISNQGACY
jgi:hypothetical protein